MNTFGNGFGRHLIEPILDMFSYILWYPISSGHALIDRERHHGQMSSHV
jgi:hypothetical protein